MQFRRILHHTLRNLGQAIPVVKDHYFAERKSLMELDYILRDVLQGTAPQNMTPDERSKLHADELMPHGAHYFTWLSGLNQAEFRELILFWASLMLRKYVTTNSELS